MGQKDRTGMLYRRNRYIHNGSGQFTQMDPIGIAGGMNLYGYALGDPVNRSDPFGLDSEDPCALEGPLQSQWNGDPSSPAILPGIDVCGEKSYQAMWDWEPGQHRGTGGGGDPLGGGGGGHGSGGGGVGSAIGHLAVSAVSAVRNFDICVISQTNRGFRETNRAIYSFPWTLLRQGATMGAAIWAVSQTEYNGLFAIRMGRLGTGLEQYRVWQGGRLLWGGRAVASGAAVGFASAVAVNVAFETGIWMGAQANAVVDCAL